MRGRTVLAVLTGMLATALSAAPARADQYDFISQLDALGVHYGSMIDMIDIGKLTCHELRFGVAPPLVLDELVTVGFAPMESAIILMAAVDNLCPDTGPAVAAWARSIGHTTPV